MDFSFDNFVVDDQNEAAYKAVRMIIENPRGSGVVCIWGESGSGKTHLLRALKAELTDISPELNVIYVRFDDFVRDYVDYLRYPEKSHYRSLYYGADVLIVDGIEDMSGKGATQTEFQRFLHRSIEDETWIVVSSVCNPRCYGFCQLITAGIVEKIGKPQSDTLVAIAKQELKKRFPYEKNEDSITEIAEAISTEFNGNPRDIRGIAFRAAFRNGLGENFEIERAKQSLGEDKLLFFEKDCR